jgi:predicted nucleic acid-binding protein
LGPTVGLVYDRAEAGELSAVVSLWNFGEVLGVLDGRLRSGRLSGIEFREALRVFSDELLKLVRLRVLEMARFIRRS